MNGSAPALADLVVLVILWKSVSRCPTGAWAAWHSPF